MNPDQPTANRPPNQDPATRGANRPALGNDADKVTPPLQGEGREVRQRRSERRAERYRLQNTASDLLYQEGVVRGLEYPANHHRVAKCRRMRHGADTYVLRSKAHSSAHYGGLIVCGSPWACPVCASVIAQRRREEVAEAFDWAYARGKKVALVTLTFPHQAADDLGVMLQRQGEAGRKLRAGEPWKRIKRRSGVEGSIRALELTHGKNGWHPHTHEAWIVDRDCDPEWLREQVSRRWASACRRAGLLDEAKEEAFALHGVDVQDAARSSDYLVKLQWGVEREVTSAVAKEAKKGHRSPFQILGDADEGDHASARLFVEYVEATRGRSSLHWSAGLKNLVGVRDRSDEEVAEDSEDPADTLALLDRGQWRKVTQQRARATILDLAEVGGYQAIADWLEYHGLPPPALPHAPIRSAEEEPL